MQAQASCRIHTTSHFTRTAGKAFSYLVMTCATLLCLFPILWVILSSFKTNAQIFSGHLWPTSFSFEGYEYALDMAPIPLFFLNSIIVSTAAMLLNVTFVSMGA
jgi:raffinose/stachyose/melibiose transport system permease protein